MEIGRSGVRIASQGLGTWSWGDTRVWRFDPIRGPTEAEEAFRTALEAGITFFDTAEVYGGGQSECLLGRFARECGREVFLATKFAPFPWRLGGSALSRALDRSLERLGRDRIDLYQIHWPYTLIPLERLMGRMADAVEEGRVGLVGVSNFSAAQMRRAQAILAGRGFSLATNQVAYSLLNRSVEVNGVRQACWELGVTLIAYSPLAMGVLSGKYRGGVQGLSVPRRKMRPFRRLPEAMPVLAVVEEIAGKYQRTPAQVALSWLAGQERILAIPGARNARQATENAGALSLVLSESDIARLDQVSLPFRR